METEGDKIERARQILQECMETRKRIEAFLQMPREERAQCDQKEIHRAFFHLWNCENKDAVKTLTGSEHGSNLCRAMWGQIKKNLDRYTTAEDTLVYVHMLSIENPELWEDMQKAAEREAAGVKPDFLERIGNRILVWMFAEPKKNRKENNERHDKPANP